MTDEVGGPSIQARFPLVWAARLSVYFLLQGAFLLLAYAYYAFDTDPQSFPPGQRLDPQHAAVHLLWGIAGTYVGFVRPHLATPFMLAFAAFYTLLAVLGTFTSQHLGMHLDTPVNLTARLFASPLTGLGLGLILVARAKDWRAVLVAAIGMATIGILGTLSLMLDRADFAPQSAGAWLTAATPPLLLLIGLALMISRPSASAGAPRGSPH